MSDGIRTAELRIAIVGMSVRLPGATTLEAFWRNLDEGVEIDQLFLEGGIACFGA